MNRWVYGLKRWLHMKKYLIEFQDVQPYCPMTSWVHLSVDGKPWFEAQTFDPPRQTAVPGKGFPVFKVEFDAFTFEFSSIAEITVCIETLSKRVLPRPIELCRDLGTKTGPNSHWLSRLPANVKSWKYRQKAVAYLRKALKRFEDLA